MRRLTHALPSAALALALALSACGAPDDAPAGEDSAGRTSAGASARTATPGETADADADADADVTAFVELGPLGTLPGAGPWSTRLGPEGGAERMYAALEQARAANLERARTALTKRPPAGETGLAFLLPGCQNTGARLDVAGRTVSAELTGGENINCVQAEYFLATFEIPEDALPADWTLPAAP
ncbi:hypothetical protein [Streptomyces sp. KLOTTS4A1]|uniref:hypothetical protein n=1 Tax=Streptomyces sp. KLOTTS4A1 TaxID=3390996 RepID=UPI0039F534EB